MTWYLWMKPTLIGWKAERTDWPVDTAGEETITIYIDRKLVVIAFDKCWLTWNIQKKTNSFWRHKIGLKVLMQGRSQGGAEDRGGATGGTGGNSPPLLTKVFFVNRLKPMRKYFGIWGVTSPTILAFQPEFVTSGLQRPDLTYISPNF